MSFLRRSRALWAVLAFLAMAACAGVPPLPPQTRPEPAPDRTFVDEDGKEHSARDEWFLQRLREADGTVRSDASARGLRSWKSWAAEHAPGGIRGKAASPLGLRSWQEAGPRNIAGRVLAVAFDSVDASVIWAGTAGGGLWRSANFGDSWTQVGGDHLPSLWIGAIAVDPHDPKVLYLGTGEANSTLYGYGGFGGLLKTVDGGQTFTRIELPEPFFYRLLVSTADSGLVLAATGSGLYRSEDAGAHFTRTLAGPVTDFAQDPKNPSRLVALVDRAAFPTSSGLSESLDSGLT